MKKFYFNKRCFFALAAFLVLALVLSVSTFAATAGSGYTVDKNKKPTNIKWSMTAEGVLSFEIDASSANPPSTTLSNVDPVTLENAAWNKTPPTYAEAVKIIIGEGITAVEGSFQGCRQVKQIEIPTSLVTLKSAFLSCTALESIYVRGNEPVMGFFDLSNVTTIGSYSIGSQTALQKIKLSPALGGELPHEAIKNVGLTEIEIPEGVTVLKNSSLAKTNSLKTVTVLGMNTEFESDDVFKDNQTYPKIKAKAGSKAAEFALANGYTFIDLDTGAETKGTKYTTGASIIQSGTTTPVSDELETFDPNEATAHGYISYKYKDNPVCDTDWAYYAETKTLIFYSRTTKYNETGRSEQAADKVGWATYKNEIEHVIVGNNIHKITQKAFVNYPNLVDVQLGPKVSQIDAQAFFDCPKLTTVWKAGGERIEGRADLSDIKVCQAGTWEGTAVEEIIFNPELTEINTVLPTTLTRIYANASEANIAFAKENYIDLYDVLDTTKVHSFYVEIDFSLPLCGDRAVFRFDEATGTLYVEGVGAISDIINYYGGGSKNQPWFSIKNQINHVVIGDYITEIGKYAFCECKNLESVEIPNVESFGIYNAAFEKCTNLKSIYRRGETPIEGTLDLSNVPQLFPWTFAYDYLIANIVVNDTVKSIGSSTFEENLNLMNVYGVPGSVAEEYATKNELTFFDKSSATPEAIKCEMPETTASSENTEETLGDVSESEISTESASEEIDDGKLRLNIIPREELEEYKASAMGESSAKGAVIICISVSIVVAAAVIIAVTIIKTKRKH